MQRSCANAPHGVAKPPQVVAPHVQPIVAAHVPSDVITSHVIAVPVHAVPDHAQPAWPTQLVWLLKVEHAAAVPEHAPRWQPACVAQSVPERIAHGVAVPVHVPGPASIPPGGADDEGQPLSAAREKKARAPSVGACFTRAA
jgi:hypothetical protein